MRHPASRATVRILICMHDFLALRNGLCLLPPPFPQFREQGLQSLHLLRTQYGLFQPPQLAVRVSQLRVFVLGRFVRQTVLWDHHIRSDIPRGSETDRAAGKAVTGNFGDCRPDFF